MKKITNFKIYSLVLVVTLFTALGCKKSKKEPLPEEEAVAKVYDRGVADGTATQQMIGPAGGTITTSDSQVSVTVLPGTVSSDVMFSIQPITSTLPLSAGKTYRLLPENVTFAKPVTITFKYDDAIFEGSDLSTVYLGFQNKDGHWQLMPNTTVNEANKTLSVESTHFSDWGVIEQVRLVADKDSININESTNLKLTRVHITADDFLGSLTDINLDDENASWRILEGEGILTRINAGSSIFNAPPSVPSVNPTVVEVHLKNLPIKRKRANAQLILLAPIKILNGTYMEGKYGGRPFYMSEVVIISQLGMIWIQGVDYTGKSIMLMVNGSAQGAFSYGQISEAGKAEIRSSLTDNVYETFYKECPVPPAQTETKYSDGNITLQNFPIKGEYMHGTFNATVYSKTGCNIDSYQLTGRFRGKKGF